MNETIKRIQNGEKELLSGLIEDNLDFIYKYIKKYDGKFLDYEDLKQEVIKEFIKAVYCYNFKDDFINNYANRKIYNRARRYLIVNIDRFIDKDEQYALCVKVYEKCKKKVGHNPSIEEISHYWYIHSSVVCRVLEYLNNPFLSNVDLKEDMMSITFDEKEIINNIQRKECVDLIINSSLSQRQKEVLLFHYGFYNGKSYSFSEMARKLDSYRQVYSDANISLIKRLKKKIIE